MSEATAMLRELRLHNVRVNDSLSSAEGFIESAEHCERTKQPNLALLYWQAAERALEKAQELMKNR